MKNVDSQRFDYGAATYEFAIPEPNTDPTAVHTTYQVANDSHSLNVLIEGHGCTDTMSGQEFKAAVTVTVDDQTYRGCGRALH